MIKIIPIKYQIALGLTMIMVTIAFVFITLGFGPDATQATMLGRKRLCESIAITSSVHLSQDEVDRIEGLLRALVERDEQILTAGIRRANGTLRVELGDHSKTWGADGNYSTETHVQVPLYDKRTPWGKVELCFAPVRERGSLAILTSPWTRLIGAMAIATFVVFSAYLSLTLKQLDPQKAIPKRVQFALDNLAEGLLVTDRRGRVLLANESFSKWAGKRPEHLIGIDAARFPWREAIVDQDPDEYPWMLALEQERPQANFLMALTDCNGRELTLVAHASPLLGNDGSYRGVLTSFEDVTVLEQKKVELSRAKDEADEANRAKSDFLARMSHEIRTPMNAILGYTEMLRRGFADDEREKDAHLATIHSSGEHLLALINDILDLSKIEAGKMEMELAKESPFELISQCVSVMKIKAEQKGIELVTEYATELPQLIVTDAVRLRQTIMNLVGNAVKFTDEGYVKLIARMTDVPGQLAIDVVDTGIGMSEEQVDRIFDPFSQADTSITRRFGGTGLGLSISKQLTERLGGGLSVSSVFGTGSIFTMTIDVGDVAGVPLVRPESVVAEEALSIAAESPSAVALTACRVLVVDDGEPNRRLVGLILRRVGAEVIEAANGQQALDRVAEQSVDVVLMDLHMPVMDGFTATKELRRTGFDGKIIALTADAIQDDEAECFGIGCDGFLTKPVNMDQLIAAITGVLSESESVPQIAEAKGDPEQMLVAGIEADLKELQDEVEATRPIYCSYPMDDPDFLEIAVLFVDRLEEKLPLFRKAAEEGEFVELRELGHWLKGAGGTVGFDPFTEPASEVEQFALANDAENALLNIEKIEALFKRIKIPRHQLHVDEVG